MDTIDYQILKCLKQDGRIAHEKIAAQVNLSRPAVRSRIVSMEKAGILEGYTTRINYDKLGFPIQVFVYIKITDVEHQKVVDAVHALQSDQLMIEDYHRIAGDWCMLIHVACKTQEDITKFVENVLRIEHVVSTNTIFVFKK